MCSHLDICNEENTSTSYPSDLPSVAHLATMVHLLQRSSKQARIVLLLSSPEWQARVALIHGAHLMFSFDHSAEQAWEAISEVVEARKFKGNKAPDWHVFKTETKDGQDLGTIAVVDCLLALEARIIKDRPLPTSGPVYRSWMQMCQGTSIQSFRKSQTMLMKRRGFFDDGFDSDPDKKADNGAGAISLKS